VQAVGWPLLTRACLLLSPCPFSLTRGHTPTQQTLERIPKMSANWYAEVVKKNRLDMM
jgi:hypothetical protein